MNGNQPIQNFAWSDEAISKVANATLDKTVTRIMYSWFQTGVFDAAPIQNATEDIGFYQNVTNDAQKKIARQVSENSTVLLKNENGTLPLNFTLTNNILMIGQDDQAMNPMTGFKEPDSSCVDASFIPQPVNVLADRLGLDHFQSDDNGPKQHCNNQSCIIYAGPNCHSIDCIPEEWKWDAAIMFVGINTAENSDRGCEFPDDVKDMVYGISKVAKETNAKSIVVVSSPGATVLEWSEVVDAQLMNYFAGEQFSDAIFNIIEGKVNPSGKLPNTMPNVENE